MRRLPGHMLCLGVPLACVLAIRLAIIGAAPFTDEGSHVAVSYHVWHQEPGDPPILRVPYINLYAILLSPLTPLGDPAFVAFRVADAAIMGCCTAVLYVLLVPVAGIWWSGAMSVIWVLCFNHPLFINAGLKNAFAPGFLLILGAMLVVARSRWSHRFWLAGAMVGLASMMREPLVVFAVPVALYVFWTGSVGRVLQMAVAGAGTLIVGVGSIGCMQSASPVTTFRMLMQNYRSGSAMYETLVKVGGFNLPAHAIAQSKDTLDVVMWAVPLWIAGSGLAVTRAARDPGVRPLVAAGIAMVLVPLPEFLLKLGFPYHLSNCFLGLCILTAVGFAGVRWSIRSGGGMAAVAMAMLFIPGRQGVSSLSLWWSGLGHGVTISRHFSPVMIRGDWTSPVVRDSFYLDTAARIRAHTRPGDTIVVSGYYSALYPLSGRRPALLDMADLTASMLARRLAWSSEDRQRLMQNLPELFVETNRFPQMNLHSCFGEFDRLYAEVDHVEAGKANYGQFACRIWKRRPGT